MADVARLAGVLVQTVSRVVNGAPPLRDSTRTRVEEAIRQLDYRPNPAARALVTRRSAAVGVIRCQDNSWGASRVVGSVQRAAREAGHSVSCVDLTDGTGDGAAEAADHLCAQGVDAIVLVAASHNATAVVRDRLIDGVPVIVVEGERDISVTGVDHHAGAVLATEHLVALGHTQAAHVTGPAASAGARERDVGWREALRAAGLRPGPVFAGDWTVASGHAAGRMLVDDERGGATSVVVDNDHMALGLMHACHELNVRVPEDLSVVGCGDVPEAAYLIPALTTVRPDFAAVGRLALEALGRAVVGDDPQLDGQGGNGADDLFGRLLRPDLVVRRSTAPARSGASGPTPRQEEFL